MENNAIKTGYVIWGCGVYGRMVLRLLNEAGCNVIACCDKNKELSDNFVAGRKIIDIEETRRLCEENQSIEIIIAIKAESMIKEVMENISNTFRPGVRVHRYNDIQDKIELMLLHSFYHEMKYQYNVSLDKYFDNWIINVLEEVQYWARNAAVDKEKWKEYYYNHKFRPYRWKHIEEFLQEESVVMEIGTGLYPFSGEVLSSGEEVHFIPVDALASFYNRINDYICKDLNMQIKEIRFGMFEFMSNLFKEDYVDMIIINNALDHCVDPFRSIVECLHILKVGGRMYLGHRRAEAVHEVWTGLHQWNIDCIDGDFVIWNKENAVNITQELKDAAEVHVTYDDSITSRSGQFVEVEVIKKSSFCIDDYIDRKQDAEIMTRCMKTFMDVYAKESKTFAQWLTEI